MSTRQERRQQERAALRQKGHIEVGGVIKNMRECQLVLEICNPADQSRRKAITAIVDTGATHSAINQRLASELGLPVHGKARLNTANGPAVVDVVAAFLGIPGKNGATGVQTIQPLSVAAMQDDLLFGMDLLNGGILTVDMVAFRWSWKLLALK